MSSSTGTLKLPMSILALIPLLALLSSGVGAASPPQLPDCALGCARNAAHTVGCPSDLSDPVCLCAHPTFTSTVNTCVRGTSCSKAEQAAVGTALTAMCQAGPSGPSGSSGAPSVSSSFIIPPPSPPPSLSRSGANSPTPSQSPSGSASVTAPPTGPSGTPSGVSGTLPPPPSGNQSSQSQTQSQSVSAPSTSTTQPSAALSLHNGRGLLTTGMGLVGVVLAACAGTGFGVL